MKVRNPRAGEIHDATTMRANAPIVISRNRKAASSLRNGLSINPAQARDPRARIPSAHKPLKASPAWPQSLLLHVHSCNSEEIARRVHDHPHHVDEVPVDAGKPDAV